MSTIAEWSRLSELLDDSADVAAAVAQAADDPGVDPWAVLIDALDGAGALAYLDWKDSGQQVAAALALLPRIADAGLDLGEVAAAEEDAPAAVAAVNRALDAYGITVVHLDEDSDAYPLVAVASGDADRVAALAQSLGRTARVYR